MTTTVQEFIKDKPPVAKVTRDDPVIAAVKRMIGDDYSQLPVVDSDNCPIGIITGESILKSMSNYATTLAGIRIKHAMLRKPQTFNQNIDLLDLFEDMSGNVALIIDDESKLVQVITDYDTAQYFRQRAQDILLVENIENTLKDFIQLAFGSDANGEARLEQMIRTMTDASFSIRQKFERGLRHYLGSKQITFDHDLFDKVFQKQLFEEGVQSYLNTVPEDKRIPFDDTLFTQVFEQHLVEKKSPPTFDDLSLGNYISLFLHNDYWPFYANIFELEKNAVTNLLENVRETRNALSHFREITPDQSIQLRDCYDLLNDHQEAVARAFAQDDADANDVVMPEQDVKPDAEIALPIDDEVVPGESRYAPLAIWLQSQPADKDLVNPTFAKIEEIIDGKLPDSAYKNRSWWANDSEGHVQSKQWLDVGWRVASVNRSDQVVRFARIKEWQKAYIDFYGALINELRKQPGFTHLQSMPNGVNWDWARDVAVGNRKIASFNYSFGRRSIFRVELYIDSGDATINKEIFDALLAQRDEIEAEVGHELTWQRLDNRRASRIARTFWGNITNSEEALAELRQKAVPAMVNYVKIMEPRVEAAGKEIL
jgi:CBS domain-containing protein